MVNVSRSAASLSSSPAMLCSGRQVDGIAVPQRGESVSDTRVERHAARRHGQHGGVQW